MEALGIVLFLLFFPSFFLSLYFSFFLSLSLSVFLYLFLALHFFSSSLPFFLPFFLASFLSFFLSFIGLEGTPLALSISLSFSFILPSSNAVNARRAADGPPMSVCIWPQMPHRVFFERRYVTWRRSPGCSAPRRTL